MGKIQLGLLARSHRILTHWQHKKLGDTGSEKREGFHSSLELPVCSNLIATRIGVRKYRSTKPKSNLPQTN